MSNKTTENESPGEVKRQMWRERAAAAAGVHQPRLRLMLLVALLVTGSVPLKTLFFL